MSFNWSKPEDEGRPPMMALALIALLSLLFALYLTVMFAWKVFDHWILAISLLTMLAFGATFFTAAIYGEYLSRPLLALFLLCSQWLSLAAWLYFQHLPLKVIWFPAILLQKHSGWVIAAFAAGFMPVAWVERLYRLSRSPKQSMEGISSQPISALDEAFQETWGRVAMPVPDDAGMQRSATEFWQREWEQWRQTMIWFMMAVLGIGAIGYRALHRDNQVLSGHILVFALMATGLLLLMQGFFLYKRAVWTGERIDTGRMSCRPWLRWFIRVLGVLVIVSMLMPAGFAFTFRQGRLSLTWSETQQLSKAKSESMHQSDMLINKVLSGVFGGSVATLMLFMLLAVLVTPLLVIMFLLLNMDRRKFKALPKILAKLIRIWMELWRGLAEWGSKGLLGLGFGRRGDSEEAISILKRRKTVYSWGKGSKAVIRRGYYHLVEEAKDRGLVLRKHQTPGEIGDSLKAMLPEERTDLDQITEAYRQARYGTVPPPPDAAGFFERLRRSVQGKLKRLE